MTLSNRSPAELAAEAMEEAGQKKAASMRASKLAARTLDRIFLVETGAIEVRKAKARVHDKYIAVEDAAIDAEDAAIKAKSKADAANILFEEWRTNEASRRQDSKFIGAQR